MLAALDILDTLHDPPLVRGQMVRESLLAPYPPESFPARSSFGPQAQAARCDAASAARPAPLDCRVEKQSSRVAHNHEIAGATPAPAIPSSDERATPRAHPTPAARAETSARRRHSSSAPTGGMAIAQHGHAGLHQSERINRPDPGIATDGSCGIGFQPVPHGPEEAPGPDHPLVLLGPGGDFARAVYAAVEGRPRSQGKTAAVLFALGRFLARWILFPLLGVLRVLCGERFFR